MLLYHIRQLTEMFEHVCMRALVYNDLILAILNECNLLFLHILLCLRLEDKSRENYMKSKTLQHVTQSSVTALNTHIYYSLSRDLK